jgi:hypothetical protein
MVGFASAIVVALWAVRGGASEAGLGTQRF